MPRVELTITNGVAWLTLNRPAKLNALDRQSVRELAACLDTVRSRDDVRVIVSRGAGRAYCAGSDIAEFAGLSASEAATLEREHAAACGRLDLLPQPTVALLHGYVLGGGLGLALYHDFRIAAEGSTLGLPEIELGWTPPWAMGRLLDVVGPTHGRWLALAGARVSADEAKLLGLVNEVVPDDQLAERGAAFAHRLAALSPTALRETKALINRMSPLRQPRWDDEAAAAFERCFATPAARSNVAAFLSRNTRERDHHHRDTEDTETRDSRKT